MTFERRHRSAFDLNQKPKTMKGKGDPWLHSKGIDARRRLMANGTPTGSIDPFLAFGREQTKSALSLQQEVLDAYERASRVWLERVKSELDLWSELAEKLAATHSVNDALEACVRSGAQQMQMTVTDGQRLFDECREVTQRVTHMLTNGLPKKEGI
jgi:hypothetical protein